METPKKAVEADRCLTCICICSTVVAKKEKLHIFGKSSLDFCEIIKSALNVNVRNFSASEQFICRTQCYQRLTKYKRALANLKKEKSELEEVYKATAHRTKRLCKDDAEGDVAKGVDKHVICTSKTRAVIGRFPIARTVSRCENQILIGHIRERNVVRKKAAVCGEERCVTSLKTAAKETIAIVRSYGNQSSAICDRNLSHNIFNSDPRFNASQQQSNCLFVNMTGVEQGNFNNEEL